MKAWLKGGLIALGITLVFAVTVVSLDVFVGTYCPENRNCERTQTGKVLYQMSLYYEPIYFLPHLVLHQVLPKTGSYEGGFHWDSVLLPVLIALQAFIVGTLIGWMYEKIRSTSRGSCGSSGSKDL